MKMDKPVSSYKDHGEVSLNRENKQREAQAYGKSSGEWILRGVCLSPISESKVLVPVWLAAEKKKYLWGALELVFRGGSPQDRVRQ